MSTDQPSGAAASRNFKTAFRGLDREEVDRALAALEAEAAQLRQERDAAVARLEALGSERPTAVMCAEGDWRRCHRRLIADALTARGWHVVHLLPDGRCTGHELPGFATVAGERLSYASQPAIGGIES